MKRPAAINPASFTDYTGTFERISAATFCTIFDHHPNFERVFVIDCRTPAEYKGGHIKTAVRCHPFMDSIPALYREQYNANTLFVFHCEFSAYRAPAAIGQFKGAHAKAGRDPKDLHAFVLDGGFSPFYAPHKDYCVGRYVPEMDCLGSFASLR
jgi:M-phase inducer tyrosine phosphatase